MNVSSTKDLLGMCFGNAYKLSVKLDNNNINNKAMCVGIKRKYPNNKNPNSADECSSINCQHFIIFIEDHDYYCEVSSEIKGEKYGNPVIWSNLPTQYEKFEDSFRYANLDPQKRTREEGKYS